MADNHSLKQNDSLLLVIGSINYDMLIGQTRLPQPGETVHIDSLGFASGGKGANQAVQAAKLGAKAVLLGSVGNDENGSTLRRVLTDYGLDVQGVIVQANERTGLALVSHTPDGQSLISVYRGANGSITNDDIDAQLATIKKASILIMQGEIPIPTVEHAIRVAHANKIPIAFNAAPIAALSDEAHTCIDYMIMNEVEAAYYCEGFDQYSKDPQHAIESAARYINRYGGVVLITLGKNGSVVVSNDQQFYIPPLKVKVRETTGAGDSYTGTFAYMISCGYTLLEAAQAGTVTSSITIQGKGAQEPMPTKDEFLRLYKQSYDKLLIL